MVEEKTEKEEKREAEEVQEEDAKDKGNLESEADSEAPKESESKPDANSLSDTNTDKRSSLTKSAAEQGKEEPKKEIKKKSRQERIGILNIYTTFNNTIMNLTDMSGKSLAKYSGGQSTKQDRLKANPTIAMFIAQRIAEEARDNGITGFYVKVRAKTGQNNPGPGTHAAIKSLTRAGFKILSIMDTTRIPRGGPKRKHGRRGRRV